jgi:cell division septum initiation protein DivIVA
VEGVDFLQQDLFKTAMRGFNKEEVTKYIAGLVKSINEKEAKLKGQLEELTKNNKGLKETLSSRETVIAEQRKHLSESEEELKCLRDKLAAVAEKKRIYDDIALRAGETIIAAQSAADSMVAEVKGNLGSVGSKFTEFVLKMKYEIRVIKSDLSKLCGISKDTTRLIDERIESLGHTLTELENGLDNTKLTEKINAILRESGI